MAYLLQIRAVAGAAGGSSERQVWPVYDSADD